MTKSLSKGIGVIAATLFSTSGCEQYVPFTVADTTGGICNTAARGSANPQIVIDSDGEQGSFVVTSILLKTAAPGVPATGFLFLTINSVVIDGLRFDTRTGNVIDLAGGSGVLESADLMGTPVRRNSSAGSKEPESGGNFPHQIVADSEGSRDIIVTLFCRSDDEDFNIAVVAAAGWKRSGDTITVTYLPGT